MTTHTYSVLTGKDFWCAAIINDKEQVVLCGNGVKIFDLRTERFVQTLGRLKNALVAVSRDHKRICAVSVSTKGTVIVQYIWENDLFVEKARTTIKEFNAVGGKPCFSYDGSYMFFCTECRKIWRYTCDSNECRCIYQVRYPDQFFALDIHQGRLLVALNSPSADEHIGFDIVTLDGNLMKSLCFADNTLLNNSVKGKWLNEEEILVLHHRSFFAPCDKVQMIPWKTANQIDANTIAIEIEKSLKGYSDMRMSPQRSYMVIVWLDMQTHYSIEIYKAGSNKKLFEFPVEHYIDIAFSDDEKYLFVCSKEFVKLDLSL